MTRLDERLQTFATGAPPLDGMAERALHTARRRRNLIKVPAAITAVVATTITVGLGLPALRDDGSVTVTPLQAASGGVDEVRFPETAEPLPPAGVGPALLTYAYEGTWRVMLRDGSHYEVTEALGEHDPEAAATNDSKVVYVDTSGGRYGLVSVSPDGERLGYFEPDGSFVTRDLESGRTEPLFEWDLDVFDFWGQEVRWSIDGRWLLASPGPPDPMGQGCTPLPDGGCRLQPDNPLADPVLVDLESGERVELPDTASLFGVSDGAAVFPYILPGMDDLALLDHDGSRRGEIDASLLPGRENDGVVGVISADGRTFAAITFGSTDSDDPATILAVDVEGGRLVGEYSLGGDWMDFASPSVVGWVDADAVLVESDVLEKLQKPDRNGSTVRTVERNFHIADMDTGELIHRLRITDPEYRITAVAYRTL